MNRMTIIDDVPNRVCFRCGDAIMYCKCAQAFHQEQRQLENSGITVGELHPWEIQLPTELELQNGGHSPEELAYWKDRHKKVRRRADDELTVWTFVTT